MVNAVPFDTLKLAERLQSGGFTPEQARTAAAALAEAVSGAELATKQDLLATKADLLVSLAETKAEIIKWMVGTIGIQTVAIIGAVLALMRMAH